MEEPYLCAGIDLGTCFSCVYVYKDGNFVHVPFNGECTVPSFISYSNSHFQFGRAAKRNSEHQPINTIYDIKRIIGRPMSECQGLINASHYSFMISADQNDRPFYYLQMENGTFCTVYPEQLDSYFVRYLVDEASRFIGQTIRDVVITVPAFFQSAQVYATVAAAKMAGLNVFQVMYEPSAAALASNTVNVVDRRHILVYDLGGGTFDVALMETQLNDYRVIMNDGHPLLGGQDFDNEVYNYLCEQFSDHGATVANWSKNRKAKLRQAAEEVKKQLSVQKEVEFDVTDYGLDDEDNFFITRDEFERMISGYIETSIEICKTCIRNAGLQGLDTKDIILLVGGSSYIPLVKRRLEKEFGEGRVLDNVNPNEVVAKGACITALDAYCHQYNRRCPITIPMVHSMVVRTVSVKFNNEPELHVVLPRGTPCNTWQMITYTAHGLFTNTRIDVYAENQEGQPNRIGGTTVRGFGRRTVFFKLIMNEMGMLQYSYGCEGQKNTTEGEIPLQNEISAEELSTSIMKTQLVLQNVTWLKEMRTKAEQAGPAKQSVVTNIDGALQFLEGPTVLQVKLEELQSYVTGFRDYVVKSML